MGYSDINKLTVKEIEVYTQLVYLYVYYKTTQEFNKSDKLREELKLWVGGYYSDTDFKNMVLYQEYSWFGLFEDQDHRVKRGKLRELE